MNIMNASPAGRVVTANGQFAICRLFAFEASAPVVPSHHNLDRHTDLLDLPLPLHRNRQIIALQGLSHVEYSSSSEEGFHPRLHSADVLKYLILQVMVPPLFEGAGGNRTIPQSQ